jgi:tetratricopeptide (TPR) repeat protein
MTESSLANELLREGIAAVKAGQKEEARQLLMQVVELDERNEQAWLWLSGIMGTPEERRICLENVLSINPDNAHAHAGLVWLDQQTPAPTAGEDHCPRCQAAVPPSATSCAACGLPLIVACPACGQSAEVDQNTCPSCRQSLGDFRQGAQYHLGLAQAYLERRRLDRAEEALARAEAEAPGDPLVLAGVGALHEKTGRLDLAIATYEQAAERDPHNPAHYTRLGALHRQRGQSEQARAMYQKAAELAGDDPANILEMARLSLEGGGTPDEAIGLLNQVLEQQPMNVPALLLLGDAFVKKQQHAQALGYYEHACKLAPAGTDLGREARERLVHVESVLQPEAAAGRRRAGSGGPRTRPGCVTTYAILTGIGGFFALMGALAVAALASLGSQMIDEALRMSGETLLIDADAFTAMLWVYVGVALFGAALNIAIAIGLWSLKNWARIAVIVLQVLSLLGSVCQAASTILSFRQLSSELGEGLSFPPLLMAWLLVGFVVQGYIIFWFVANREVFD